MSPTSTSDPVVRRALLVGLLGFAGCMPPPVRAVDDWLKAYAASDTARQLALTAPKDRVPLRAALEAPPTSRASLALPPHPIAHEILDIVERAEARQVVEVRLTIENPLPAASRRVGQAMPGIPRTRTVRHRFLAVRASEAWRVQLDLARVLERAAYAEHLLKLVVRGQLAEAETALQTVPPVPDDGHRSRKDRMVEEMARRIEEARSRTSTVGRRR